MSKDGTVNDTVRYSREIVGKIRFRLANSPCHKWLKMKNIVEIRSNHEERLTYSKQRQEWHNNAITTSNRIFHVQLWQAQANKTVFSHLNSCINIICPVNEFACRRLCCSLANTSNHKPNLLIPITDTSRHYFSVM